MDANIKAAAKSLQRAAYDMQVRINEIRGQEYREKRELDSDEDRIARDAHRVEFDLARAMADKAQDQNGGELVRKSLELTKQVHELKKRGDQLKGQTRQRLSAEEKEIRSLQAQADKLLQIAHTLEMWP